MIRSAQYCYSLGHSFLVKGIADILAINQKVRFKEAKKIADKMHQQRSYRPPSVLATISSPINLDGVNGDNSCVPVA